MRPNICAINPARSFRAIHLFLCFSPLPASISKDSIKIVSATLLLASFFEILENKSFTRSRETEEIRMSAPDASLRESQHSIGILPSFSRSSR